MMFCPGNLELGAIKAKAHRLSKDCNNQYESEFEKHRAILKEFLSAEQVYCELPFCYKDGTDIRNGIMDVVYCKNGI